MAYLEAWLIYTNEMLNVNRPMNDAQIQDAAETILAEFPLMTIADVVFVFNKVKSGGFGAMYEGIDIAKICTWFRQHWDDRLNAAESEALREHERFRYENEQARSEREAQVKADNAKMIRETIKQQYNL